MPAIVDLDIKNIPLTEFMKALGQEHPVSADGNLRVYNAPYDDNHAATMVINTETNLWRDTNQELMAEYMTLHTRLRAVAVCRS